MKSTNVIISALTLLLLSISSVGFTQPQFRDAKKDLAIQTGKYKLISFRTDARNQELRDANEPYCTDSEVAWIGPDENPALAVGTRMMIGFFNRDLPSDPPDIHDPDACKIKEAAVTLSAEMKFERNFNCKWGSAKTQIDLLVDGTTLRYSIVTTSSNNKKLASNRLDCVLKLQP